MNLIIFGATGGTGQHLVEQAIKRGHQVKAFSRTPSELPASGQNLTVVKGDAANPQQVSVAVEGTQAVISVLGPTKNKPVLTIKQATELIVRAMREPGVRRLVISAGAGVEVTQGEPDFFHRGIKLMLKLVSRWVNQDMKATVETVRRSELGWTIVRLLRLTDGEPVGQVRAGYLGSDIGMSLTRADMARFMLNITESRQYLK